MWASVKKFFSKPSNHSLVVAVMWAFIVGLNIANAHWFLATIGMLILGMYLHTYRIQLDTERIKAAIEATDKRISELFQK